MKRRLESRPTREVVTPKDLLLIRAAASSVSYRSTVLQFTRVFHIEAHFIPIFGLFSTTLASSHKVIFSQPPRNIGRGLVLLTVVHTQPIAAHPIDDRRSFDGRQFADSQV